MNKLSLKSITAPVLFAAPQKGAVEIARFTDPNGDVLLSTAAQVPYSPVDGAQMQIASSQRVVVPEAKIRQSFVSIGKCSHCHSDLVASASLADAIEAAGEEFHCPVCTASVTPHVDNMQLVRALAAEFEDDDTDVGDEDDAPVDDEDYGDAEGEEDFGDDAGEDVGDYADEDDLDDEGDDDVGADIDDVTEQAGDDDMDADDVGGDVDDSAELEDVDLPEHPEDGDDAVAALISGTRSRRAAKANEECVDGEEPDTDDKDEIEEAASQLRRIIRRKQKAARFSAVADDGDGDEDDLGGFDRDTDGDFDDADHDDVDDDVEGDVAVPDEEAVAALASFVRKEYKRHGLRYPATAGANGVAGKPVERAGVSRVLEAAKDRLRRNTKVGIGHSKLRTQALADVLDTDENVDALADRVSDVTPGTSDTPVVEALGPGEDTMTPGTEATAIPGDGEETTTTENTQAKDEFDGNALAGDSLVDWARDRIEIVASAHSDDRWVMANGRPVARLVREKASAGVVGVWDTPTLETSFLHSAKNGLSIEEAREFGFVPMRFRVDGSDAIRTAMRRSAQLSTENANKMAQANVERHRQSLRTAMLASIKGVVPDVKNPVRDRLIADLAKLGVHDAGRVVDSAFASCVDDLVIGVFAYADDLAAKPDAARNEAAAFVAKATYQSRDVAPAAELASTLASGSKNAFAFKAAEPTVAKAREDAARKQEAASTSVSERVRLALRSIR